MTSFIFRSHIHGQIRTEWVVCKVSFRAGILFLVKRWELFLESANLFFTSAPPPQFSLLLFSLLSEPPETDVDNEHDEKDTPSCQLGIGGAGIEIPGVTLVLPRKA